MPALSKRCMCREERLPGWRAGADLALTKPQSAASPPPPGTYHLTDLIQSIESRLRESAAGGSQQSAPQTENSDSDNDSGLVNASGTSESAELIRAEGGFVTISQASFEGGSESSSPDSTSTVGSQTLQRPNISEPTGIRTASPHAASSQNRQEQEIIVVLSVDNEQQHQLEDAEALWQVVLALSLIDHSQSVSMVRIRECHGLPRHLQTIVWLSDVCKTALQGTRLYVVSNSSSVLSKTSLAVEKWAVYEDDDPLRSWSPTASRSALGAFLAYRSDSV